MLSPLLRSLVSCAALFAGVLLTTGSARADDQEHMQGSWRVIFAEIGGKEANKEQLKGLEVIVEGDKFTLVEGARKEVVHFSLSPDSKPKTIDFFKSTEKKEKVWLGIYAFDGKDLKLCWGPAGKDRPKEFGAKKSNQDRYFILRKK
jgi:uncharacterized protein (TIGR03067 family)